MADGGEPAGTWRTLAEVAAALGISERTVRRRIDAGRYQTRHDDSRVLVFLPFDWRVTGAATVADSPPAGAGGGGTTPAVDGKAPAFLGGMTPTGGQMADPAGELAAEAVSALERVLREERQRAGAAEQAAAMWQERARNLEAEVGRLQELLALPAHEEAEEAEQPCWRWWQRWRRPAGSG